MVDKASDLFGKVNVYEPREGKRRVEIYIRLTEPPAGEDLEVGIAIDGSRSMIPVFAAHIPKAFRTPTMNLMDPVVRSLGRYVCKFTKHNTVHLIYWAVGPSGKEVEPIGEVDAETLESIPLEGPSAKPWGFGTRLLPAFDYFLKEISPWSKSVFLFITDGGIEDIAEVKKRSMEVGRAIVDGTRGPLRKLVAVGLAHKDVTPEEVQRMRQEEELGDMFDGTELEEKHFIDLWDNKIATKMDEVAEVLDEIDFGVMLPGSVTITDDKGNVVQTYSDAFPQRMEFWVPEVAKSVTLEIAGQTITQPLD